MKDFLKRVSFATSANIFVLFVSVFSTFLFPKIMTVKDFSLWQLYVLYSGYVTLAAVGIIEGIYLLYGGKKYEELDEKKLSFATIAILVSSIVFMSTFFILSFMFEKNIDKMVVVFFTMIEGVVWNLRIYPLFVLQATNRFKEFSIALIIGRLFFLIVVIALLILGLSKYYYFLIADIFGCIICAIYAFSKCKDKLLNFKNNGDLKNNLKAITKFANVGYKLLVATIISVAILGSIRLIIMHKWSLIEFGKVSLTITCTNLFLKFATSIGQVLFPTLRNIRKDKIKSMFYLIINFINILFCFVFLFYKPVEYLFLLYLPDYKESFFYMGYLLPICIFETQVALVHNTFYKVLRKEKDLMNINLIILIISIIMAFICAYIFKNLFITVLLILFILILRCILLEANISKKEFKKLTISFDSIIITIVFIISNRYLSNFYGVFLYLIFLLIYLCIKRKKIFNMISIIKK